MRQTCWVIEIDSINGPCWITAGGSDPERTHQMKYAKSYLKELEAQKNASALQRKYPQRMFRVVALIANTQVQTLCEVGSA